MALTLERIKPLHPDFHPDPNWERIGMTPEGHQLFKSSVKMVKAVHDVDEETGVRRQMLHPTTAQPLYPMNKPKHYTQVRVFYLVSEGNGNIIKVDWSAPTEEEIAALDREEGIKEIMPEIAGQLYDMDMTPFELAGALKMIAKAMRDGKEDVSEEPVPAVDKGAETPQPVDTRPVPDPDVEETAAPLAEPVLLTREEAKAQMHDDPNAKPPGHTYPRHVAGGVWELSDGTKMGPGKGLKHEATVAEAALHEPVPA